MAFYTHMWNVSQTHFSTNSYRWIWWLFSSISIATIHQYRLFKQTFMASKTVKYKYCTVLLCCRSYLFYFCHKYVCIFIFSKDCRQWWKWLMSDTHRHRKDSYVKNVFYLPQTIFETKYTCALNGDRHLIHILFL